MQNEFAIFRPQFGVISRNGWFPDQNMAGRIAPDRQQ
jgi:hypothetical protein